MIKDLTINASARDGLGKGPTRRLRAKGMIPAAIYGEGGDALAIAVSAKEIAEHEDRVKEEVAKATSEGMASPDARRPRTR